MWRFMKHYALEIYTVLAMLFMVVTSFMNDLSIIQLFVVVFNLLFILHEWEETAYPGGFIDLISSLVEKNLTDDMRRASRIPAGILLAVVTLVPFIYDDVAMFAVSIATFGILEGFVHTMGIRLFRLKRFYTPGMVTAWLELATSIALITYLAIHHLAHWYDYVCGALMLIICFAIMQKTITMMVGVQYSDVPRLLKKQLTKK